MLISVIIPTYNRSSYLKRALKSVLDQEYSNFEVLVCDNGSTDDSKAQCESFSDSRIIWLDGSNKTKHPSEMRNLGLMKAGGEIICFLDSDDYWFPSHLINVNTALKKYSVVAQFHPTLCRKKPFNIGLSFLTYKNYIITTSVAFKRNLLPYVGVFPVTSENNIYEDYAYWLRIVALTNIRLVPIHSVFYDINSPNSRGKQIISNITGLLNVFYDFEKWAKNNNIRLNFFYYFNKCLSLLKARIGLMKKYFSDFL